MDISSSVVGDETQSALPTSEVKQRFEAIYGHPPDAEAEEIVSTAWNWWHEQDAAMWERFHTWIYNIRFTDGEQWLITLDGRAWFDPPAPDGQVRVTNNLTHRAMQYRVSKLTEAMPIGKVLPQSNEVADADKAEAAQQLLGHLYRELDVSGIHDEALWYDALCGCAFYYVGWETETGEFVVAKKSRIKTNPDGTTTEDHYFVDANGQEVGSPDDAFVYRTGDVSMEAIPPWCIRVSDPQQTDFKKQFRIMWASAVEVSQLKRFFGPAADGISGGDEYDQYVYFEDLVSSWATTTFRKRPRDKPFEPRTLLLRIFERPSTQYPGGRYIVVADKKLLVYRPLPYGPEIPIEQIKTTHRAKDFYGKPTVEDLIPIQKRINQLESHALEYIRLFSKGGITAEYGTIIEESWHEIYGSILYYSGQNPQPLSWPGLTSDVWQALNRAYENFDRISGWSDVARGNVPPGVKAAKAILELKRSNDTPLGKALQRFDRATERTCTQMISRARWGYVEPHWVQLIGADAPHLTRSMVSDDIPERFTVKIESDSLLRLSYPAKLELLFDLADRQWISAASAMKLLNFADWEFQSGQWNRDYGRARAKIDNLIKGMPVEVQWWEDDAVHMLALEERLKDPRFESLPPSVKMQLTQLWVAHYRQSKMKEAGMLPDAMQAAMPFQMGQPTMTPTQAPTQQGLAGLLGPGGQNPQQPGGQPPQPPGSPDEIGGGEGGEVEAGS